MSHIKTGWILFVDADEVVTPQLANEIKQLVATKNGYYVPRQDIIWGRLLKYGDVSQVCLLRLAKVGAGQWHGRVHETWNIPNPVGYLHHPLLHYPHPTLAKFLTHINTYSTIRARELYESGVRTNIAEIVSYPLSKFVLNWILKLGFLDSTPGFIHAMVMAFYSFLVRGKLYLLHKGIHVQDN
jgi:hypothetical protein